MNKKEARSHYSSTAYLKELYGKMSPEQLKKKRSGFVEMQRFHSIAQNHGTVTYYTRLIGIIDEVTHGDLSPLARSKD